MSCGYPECDDWRPKVLVDLGYSHRFVRFVVAHLEEYRTAYLAPTPATSSALLERLRREYITLPPRHICSCRCPAEGRGWPACPECRRLRTAAVKQDIANEPRHGKPVLCGTVPPTVLLDLAAGYV